VRLAVFTADPQLEQSPWWPIVMQTPGLTGVIVCRQVVSRRPRDMLRRLRRNIAKHGLIFVPYRIVAFAWSLVRRAGSRSHLGHDGGPGLPPETLEALDLHAAAALERVRQWQPDLGLSIGAPVLRPALFEIPKLGTLNLHLGRVPDYRGAPPGFWELYTGAHRIGATVHWIDRGLDTGAVVRAGEALIYEDDTLARVEARACELGRHVLRDALRQVATGASGATPQPVGGHTFRFPTLRQRARLAGRLALRRWARRLGNLRGVVKTVAILAWLFLYRPARDLVRTLRRRHPIRVFTFHRVTELCRDGMTVAPEVFRRQVAYVFKYHEIVSLDRALEALRAGARLRRPLAVLAFDDGYRSVWDAARPVLAAYGVPASCFVCSGLVGSEQRLPHDEENVVRPYLDLMGWDELRALHDAGWTVGAHTISHVRLVACLGETLRREIVEPAATIGSRLACRVTAIAYPFGGRNDISTEARIVIRECGYEACLSNFGGENHAPANLSDVRRIDIGGDHDTLAWKAWTHGWDHHRWSGWWARAFAQGTASNPPEPA